MQNHQFKEYKYRFVIISLYIFVVFLNQMSWTVASPIQIQVSNAYSVSESIMSLIPMSYMIMYIFMNVPCSWVLDSRGIRISIILGASLSALGCIIRCFVNISFVYALVGQVLCAIAQPFSTNASSNIAVRWYKPQNRSFALALLSVSPLIGSAIGYIIPLLFVSGNVEELPQIIRHQFLSLSIFNAALGILSVILVVLLFHQSPPTLPSYGAQATKIAFKDTFKILFTSPKFIMLVVCFAIMNGVFNMFGSVLQFILQPYNYTSNDVTLFLNLMIGSGVILAGILGNYTEKTLNYHIAFRICGTLGIISIVCLVFTIQFFSNVYWLMVIIFVLMGLVLVPIVPLSIDYGCEIMFPVGQAQITGIIICSSQVSGILFILVSQQIFDLKQNNKQASYYTILAVCVIMFIGCIPYYFFHAELKRSNLQRQKQSYTIITQ